MKTGGPAFPGQTISHHITQHDHHSGMFHTVAVPTPYEGMSLRAYIATKAMAGLLAGNAVYNGRSDDRAALARDAVAHADALIAELEKNGGDA